MFERYIRALLRWHKAVVIVCVMVTGALSYGALRLTVTNDMRAYFSDHNPQLQAFDALENIYDKQDNVDFTVVAKNGNIFTEELLTLLWELTELGWQVPYSQRSSSLANFQYTWSEGDDLHVADLIQDPTVLDDQAIQRIKRISMNEPTLAPTLSSNGRSAMVLIMLALPDGNLKANDEVAAWVRARIGEYAERFPNAELHFGGTAATNTSLGEAVAGDLSLLIPLSYLVIIVGLLVLLRHFGGMAATMLVASFAVAGTMGIFGWFNAVLEAVSGFAPSIVMTIAVADSVHILTTYYYELRRGAHQHAAIAESLRMNARPIFITTVTTIVGVLTLNFSDSPPYRDLGNMVAVGVGLAWLLSMSLLPALMTWGSSQHAERGQTLESLMSVFANWVINRYRSLLLVIGAFGIGVAAFIPQNVLTENWHLYFDDSFKIRRSFDAINDNFGWLHVLRYSVESDSEGGINDPTYLAEVERFAEWYDQQPGVVHVARIGQVLKRLNMNLHGDDPDEYRLPTSAGLSAQYLLLYELALPQGLGLDNAINVERSATQFISYISKTDSEELLKLDVRARRWLAANTSLHAGEATGMDMMFAHINHRNIRGLLKGMVIALIIISALLVFALGSLRLGMLSLITNLAPVGLAYGTWALINGRIDMSASVVMCMSIGIIVDDTVHFLSKYQHARRVKGLIGAEAMRYTFNTVGVALAVTTAVLVAGFLVLTASHFSPTATTGMLMSITLVFALLVDFLFMPPLLIALDRRWQMN